MSQLSKLASEEETGIVLSKYIALKDMRGCLNIKRMDIDIIIILYTTAPTVHLSVLKLASGMSAFSVLVESVCLLLLSLSNCIYYNILLDSFLSS